MLQGKPGLYFKSIRILSRFFFLFHGRIFCQLYFVLSGQGGTYKFMSSLVNAYGLHFFFSYVCSCFYLSVAGRLATVGEITWPALHGNNKL